ncbi:hemolysin III family protein, partial [Mycobacterium tuberculosis]
MVTGRSQTRPRYSIGGILYAVRWPAPWPTTFGYHEFFHACT